VALMVRIFDAQFLSLNVAGLLWGLVSGVLYGLYSIFIRRTLKHYSFWTTITYAFAAGALFLLTTQSPSRMVSAFAQPGAAWWLVILALVPTLIGYTLFVFGLRFLEATVATILATIEPVMATLWAALFLGEWLTWPQIIGGVLVIAGVVALQR
jgi:drug/metabolite transporter (DMT)-like permease